MAACCIARPALADVDLDPGGLTFRNFGISDNGSSFSHFDSTFGNNAANPTPSRVLAIDNENGLARVRFDTIRAEVSLPLGWQATEDWERGVAFSGDKRYRLILWRVDFAFEGVSDAERRVVFDLVLSKPGNPKEGVLLTLGVPAADADRGLKLMALLKSKLRIDW